MGMSKAGLPTIATIEPWHGHQVVIYRPEAPAAGARSRELPIGLWAREVIDEDVPWGHAVWFSDVDADGSDELLIGQRDPRPGTTPPKGPGLWLYDLDERSTGDRASGPQKSVIDDGGMATEDALAADLDADGRPEIIAGGRATHNVRIYWNRR
jgi:hypothetical protein